VELVGCEVGARVFVGGTAVAFLELVQFAYDIGVTLRARRAMRNAAAMHAGYLAVRVRAGFEDDLRRAMLFCRGWLMRESVSRAGYWRKGLFGSRSMVGSWHVEGTRSRCGVRGFLSSSSRPNLGV